MVRTYSEVFPNLCVKTVPNSGNRIFFANREQPADLAAKAKKWAEKAKLPWEIGPYAEVECLPAQEPGAALLVDEK
jgi:hypothetical protein